MRVISLQSGSNGNCIYVESGSVRLLFDAGISGKQAELRLAAHGRDIRDITAVVISHDHSDHVRCLGIYQRKFQLPVYVTAKTIRAATARRDLGRLGDVRPFRAGAMLPFGPVTVETIPTPHDGADGVAFVVGDGRRRLGILTDLGHVFPGLAETVASLDAALLESNYDPAMLDNGPYPASVKRRIRGPGGHLSNAEAAELLAGAGGGLRWACLAHLSGENNSPSLALRTHRGLLGSRFPLHLASRRGATDVLEV